MTIPAVTATDSLSPIAARFASLREQGRMALMPFLMAGDPDLSTTAEVLLSLQAQGADMVELGIPPGFTVVPGTFESLVEQNVIERFTLTDSQATLYIRKIAHDVQLSDRLCVATDCIEANWIVNVLKPVETY